MKIVFFDDRYHMVYGAQENVLLLAEWSAAAGRDVLVMTTGEGPFAASARERGLAVKIVEAPWRLMRFDRNPISGNLFERVLTLLDATWFNLVMLRELRKSEALLTVASTPRAALWLVLAAMLRRPSMLLWIQGDERRRLMALVTGWSAWRIGLIGPRCRNLFAPRVRRQVEHKFRALPSARDMTKFRQQPARARDADGPIRIVSIGSITRRKGFDLLLEALAELDTRNFSLTIVGGTINDNSLRYFEELEKSASRFRLDVDFVGWCDDVRPFLWDADMFVLASRSEGLPGVLLEAMASGVPCVTTRAGDAGVLVEQCDAGLAVDVDDVDGLATALRILMEDSGERQRFGENGRRNVELLHSPEVSYEAFESIIAEMVG